MEETDNQSQKLWDVSIITSKKEGIKIYVKGADEKEALNNLDEAINLNPGLTGEAESYYVESINEDEGGEEKLDALVENQKKIDFMQSKIAEYLNSLNQQIKDNPEEKERLKNGALLFIYNNNGNSTMGHTSKSEMEKLKEMGFSCQVLCEFTIE
jgi:tetratricopeptide (TPR) repeat protein